MAIIFENKRIEKDDTGSIMKFPGDANKTNLPRPYGKLTVIDEGGTQWELEIKNEDNKVSFTKGWEKSRVGKDIEVGHKISLYEADEADRYRIIVGEN